MAIQMLYQADLGEATAGEVCARFDTAEYIADEMPKKAGRARGAEAAAAHAQAKERVERAFEHARRLVEGTLAHREEIDTLIQAQAENWRLERMPAVDRNILRLAVFEMLHESEVPKLVVVNEAIELAKRYGSESSGRFVNGLLDGLLKTHEFPGALR